MKIKFQQNINFIIMEFNGDLYGQKFTFQGFIGFKIYMILFRNMFLLGFILF